MSLTPDHFDSQPAELLRSGRPVLAGISGGRDSMALLSLLSGMEGCRVIACHVHHGLRPEADEEAQFVREYAASAGVPCVWRRADVAGMAHVQGISTEEAARKTRQNLFLEWVAEYPGALVALAHHRNDQQETALLHLCRGASGIHGMSPVSIWANGLTVVRPLLNFSRKEITAYLEEKNIPWREDASNQSTEYTRNALRHHVVPRLNEIFRRDTSLSFSRACRIENQIRTALAQALEAMDLTDPQGRLYLPGVNRLPQELKQCAVHHYLRQQSVPDLTEAAVLRVMKILDADGPSRTSLPGGKMAVRKEKRLFVKDAPPQINKGEPRPADTAGGI